MSNRSLARRGPEPNDNLEPWDNSTGHTGSHHNLPDQAPQGHTETSEQTSATSAKPFKCPHKNCDHGTFRRRQELVRHYATRIAPSLSIRSTIEVANSSFADCKYGVSCVCSATFNTASKYIYHQCKQEKDQQRAYTVRWELLRKEVERELQQAGGVVHSGSERRRRKVAIRSRATLSSDPFTNASLTQGAPPQLPEEATLTVQEAPSDDLPLQSISGASAVPINFDAPAGVNKNPQPYSYSSVSTSTQQARITEPPLFWDLWGTTQPYASAQTWDSWNSQDQDSFQRI